jgi:hypothetical protein
MMTMGGGAVQSISRKQNILTQEALQKQNWLEHIMPPPMILWTRLFLEAQGIKLMKLFSDKTTSLRYCWRKMLRIVPPKI